MTLIYIAGPLFTPAERDYLEEIADSCSRPGFHTYLPHRDGGVLRSDREDFREVFARDLQALDQADVILAILHGPDVDSGTAWEIGYAFRAGKKVVALAEDFRIRDAGLDLNPMLAASCLVTFSRAELREALKEMGRG